MAHECPPEQPIYRDAAALLDACQNWVHRFMVLSQEQGNVLAVWILHTWAIDAADYTPYLHITAAEKECGKSRLLETLEPIVNRPCMSVGTTAAALLRVLHRDSPTLLLDEIDTTFGGSKDAAESIRGILNAGFRRGGIHRKCEGKSHQLQEFKAFGPKGFAGIGGVPDTVASRSIVIELKRKSPDQIVEPFRLRDVTEARKPLVASLEAWSKSGVVEILREKRPAFPDGFGDRQQDISEPLLAIADLAGGEWPSTVRRSLLALFHSEASEDSSLGVTLLTDIRSVFDSRSGKDSDRIFSAILTRELTDMEGSPWADWEKGKGFTANTIARLLKKYHIHPQTIRIGESTQKGYMRDSFSDAWSRYVRETSVRPSEIAVTPVTPVTVPILEDFSPFREPSHTRSVTASMVQQKPRQTPIVTAVTPVTALQEQEEPKRFLQGVL